MDEPQRYNNAPPQTMSERRSRYDRVRHLVGRSLPLTILAFIVLLALVGGAIFAGVQAASQPRPISATARIGDVILSTQASGVIQATVYQADFPVDGALSEIDVTVGQQVRKGDTLAKLDVAPFESALAATQTTESAAQQSLSDAQSAVGQAQAAQSDALTAFSSAGAALSAQQTDAQTQCAAQPSVPAACSAATAAAARTQAQVDAAQAQVSASQTQFALAQALVSQAQKSLTAAQNKTQIAQAQLAATTLLAPHAGIVTSINGAVGGRPGATATGADSFITIMDTSAPLVTALVSYSDIGAIQIGQTATFRVAQISANALFTGAVTGVSPQGQGAGAALRYPVLLRIDPASLGKSAPLPGMATSTRIITRARYHVIVIAASAVSYARQAAPASGKGLLTHSQISVALAQAHTLELAAVAAGFPVSSDPLTTAYLVGFAHGHYVALPVVLGLSDGSQWEVVAGLIKGQQVVSGQRNLLFG